MTVHLEIDSHWDYSQPAESQRRFCELLSSADPPPDSPFRLQLLTQIARANGLQRQIDLAHQTLDLVERSLNEADRLTLARYLLERGRVLNSSGERGRSQPLLLQAWQVALEAGEDFYAVDAAHMLAIVESGEERLAWNQRAVDLAEGSTDTRARSWLGSLYNNIGWYFHDAGQYDKALEIFERAVECRRLSGGANLRVAHWCVARAWRSLGRYQEALERHLSLLAEAPDEDQGHGHEEIGECLLALGRPEEAQAHFACAYRILSQDAWFVAESPERLDRIRALAKA